MNDLRDKVARIIAKANGADWYDSSSDPDQMAFQEHCLENADDIIAEINDPLAAARGIGWALVISIPFWIALIVLVLVLASCAPAQFLIRCSVERSLGCS